MRRWPPSYGSIFLDRIARLRDKLVGPTAGADPCPAPRPPAQSEASRLNGARSAGPASAAGKARAALNGVRHGLCRRTLFLLPDEDPAEFLRHEALWLAAWRPRDLHEHQAAEAAVRCMWREERADRLEAVVLSDLFAAGRLADPAEAEAAKAVAFKALGTLLRYRGRIEREHRAALSGARNPSRQRRLARPVARPRRTRAGLARRPLRRRLPPPPPRSPSPPSPPRPTQRPPRRGANPSPPPP